MYRYIVNQIYSPVAYCEVAYYCYALVGVSLAGSGAAVSTCTGLVVPNFA